MKKQVENDERVVAQRRKIGSDAFQILAIGLFISVLVQQYLFNAPFVQYAAEIVLFIAIAIYVLIRNLMVGNDLFAPAKNGQKMVVINSAVCGLVVTVINTVLNYMKYQEAVQMPMVAHIALVAGIMFISSTASVFVVLELVYLANKKKQKEIETRFNEAE